MLVKEIPAIFYWVMGGINLIEFLGAGIELTRIKSKRPKPGKARASLKPEIESGDVYFPMVEKAFSPEKILAPVISSTSSGDYASIERQLTLARRL